MSLLPVRIAAFAAASAIAYLAFLLAIAWAPVLFGSAVLRGWIRIELYMTLMSVGAIVPVSTFLGMLVVRAFPSGALRWVPVSAACIAITYAALALASFPTGSEWLWLPMFEASLIAVTLPLGVHAARRWRDARAEPASN